MKLVDVAREAGITFRHTSGRSGRFYLPETLGSGCAFLDYNRDGRLDLFLVNSGALPGFAGKGPFYPALMENRGDGTFTDVTRGAGLAVERYGMGCCVGDYDNDGDPDLYLTAMGPNVLFRNNGDATFTDVTQRAGVGDRRWSTSAAWLDYDRDGWLDLFVCNYCIWSPLGNVVTRDEAARPHMVGPNYYAGAPSALYRNRGDGVFENVTRRAGVFHEQGKALGVAVWDTNDDGWPEVAVASDLRPNLLYRNRGECKGFPPGTFVEVGVPAGLAFDGVGQARAGMGIDTGDYERRGHDAVAIGNFSEQGLGLYRNDGGGLFTDVASLAGLWEPSSQLLTFGLLFTDYDLDGYLDLLVANGHIDENVADLNGKANFAERMLLFHNQGPVRESGAVPVRTSMITGASFLEVGEPSGPGLAPARVARGLAAGDYDGDGDPDYLVSVNNGPAVLLQNDAIAPTADRRPPTADRPLPNQQSAIRNRQSRHWLAVRTVGTRSNRDGIGTKVVLEAGSARQQRWIRSGSSYCSQSDLVAHFGLGRETRVERVRLQWPSGTVDELRDVAVDRVIVVREGESRTR